MSSSIWEQNRIRNSQNWIDWPICKFVPWNKINVHFIAGIQKDEANPCIDNPCGPNSQCRVVGNQGACSCLPNYIGRPPNCRPECTINAECASNKACINELCVDPCIGKCGENTLCSVVKHNPVCNCISGYEGDPFTRCTVIVVTCKNLNNFILSKHYHFHTHLFIFLIKIVFDRYGCWHSTVFNIKSNTIESNLKSSTNCLIAIDQIHQKLTILKNDVTIKNISTDWLCVFFQTFINVCKITLFVEVFKLFNFL